jgi:2,3-bisphosphoglycerate-independent phosphoglycerate mutase
MQVTMDRYEANWGMVEKGWRTHVQGEGRMFPNALAAIETFRNETGCIDQDLPAFVIERDGAPVGKIENGDSVILFNFRGDRAQEISLAFDRKDFDKFDRPGYTGVKFAGMLQYDGDLNIPENYLVQPPVITNTLTEVMVAAGVNEYAVSETQKYGHVTYFWNGNRSGKVSEELETYEEIPSDVIPFEQAPAMKSKEITEKMVDAMASGKYQFLRCNFPNGDMVGHTGVMDAVVYAMECVDNGLKAIIEAADKYGYTVLITADHGNADQMTETKKGKTSVRTAHSLNPVPFIIYDPSRNWEIKDGAYGLANVAPTVVKMMGLTAPECWEDSMV